MNGPELRKVIIRIEQQRNKVVSTIAAEGMGKGQRKEFVRNHSSMAAAMTGAASMLLHGVTAGTQADIQQAMMVAAGVGLVTPPEASNEPVAVPTIEPPNPEDIMVWPDGVWCYREAIEEMAHKSDDYLILSCDTQAYREFLAAEGED